MAKVKNRGLPAKPLVLMLMIGMGVGSLIGYYLPQPGAPSTAPPAVPPTMPPIVPEGFCGLSTNGGCFSDSDCLAGGCSGQACQSRYEKPIVTTCEWRDCYDSEKFGVDCRCVNTKCQWSK